MSWSPDGTCLAVAGQSVEVWDFSDSNECRLRHELESRANGRLSRPGSSSRRKFEKVAWSPDGRWVAAVYSYGSKAEIWDAKTGAWLGALPDTHSKYKLAWSPNSKQLATVESVGDIKVWDIELIEMAPLSLKP